MTKTVKTNYFKSVKPKILEQVNKVVKHELGHEIKIPVTINGRLSKTYGRYVYKRGEERQGVRIEIQRAVLENNDDMTIYQILMHEAIHYLLHIRGSNEYSDGDNEFESLVRKYGALSQSDVDQRKVKVQARKIKIYNYSCIECKYNYRTKKKLVVSNYKCTCGGKLQYNGYELK